MDSHTVITYMPYVQFYTYALLAVRMCVRFQCFVVSTVYRKIFAT